MTQKIEQETRVKIAKFLPDAISKTLKSYEGFIERGREDGDSPKEFSAHHAACKAAISHLELLLKLARWANLPDRNGDDNNKKLMDMIAQAENKVVKHKRNEEEEL